MVYWLRTAVLVGGWVTTLAGVALFEWRAAILVAGLTLTAGAVWAFRQEAAE